MNEQVQGFVDSESCFFVNVRKNSKSSSGTRVELQFSVKQERSNISTLFALNNFFGKGHVRWANKAHTAAVFEINSFAALNSVLVPFLSEFPLKSSKALNCIDFLRVLIMINNKEHLTLDGLNIIRDIKAGMNSNRSHADKIAYIESVAESIEITPGWVSGFMAGDGSLGISLTEGSINPKASFGQNNHDEALLEAIKRYFNLTNKLTNNKNPLNNDTFVQQLSINGYQNPAVSQLIDILTEYPLFTNKCLDFEVYKTVVTMMLNKHHMTKSGFASIKSMVLANRLALKEAKFN